MSEREKHSLIPIEINPNIDINNLLITAEKALPNDLPLKRRLGDERFEKLNCYVLALLRGEPVFIEDIDRDQLDGKLIRRKATSIVRNLQFMLEETRSVEARMSRFIPPKAEDRLLQDPNVFLGDRSHRKSY